MEGDRKVAATDKVSKYYRQNVKGETSIKMRSSG